MAQAYLETTQWAHSRGCNHTYLLEGDRMLAYLRHGTAEPFWFSKPITISRSGRKFQQVHSGAFDSSLSGQLTSPQPDPDVRQVQGSKPGAVYLVNTKEQSCTCPGYTYRGACKHVKELE